MLGSKRFLRPRFSLRTFMLICTLVGGCFAWVSHHYRLYQAEQHLIELLADRSNRGSLLDVQTNGTSAYLAGRPYM